MRGGERLEGVVVLFYSVCIFISSGKPNLEVASQPTSMCYFVCRVLNKFCLFLFLKSIISI